MFTVAAALDIRTEFEDPKVAEQIAKAQLYQKAVDMLVNEVPNAIRTRIVNDITKVVELELYVFTPLEYHAAVSLAARRLLRAMQHYPMYDIGPDDPPNPSRLP